MNSFSVTSLLVSLLIIANDLQRAEAIGRGDGLSSKLKELRASAARQGGSPEAENDRPSSMKKMMRREKELPITTAAGSSRLMQIDAQGEGATTKLHAISKELKIDVYVINLDARQDRCLRMSKQLASAPYSVYRQKALHPSACNLPDDQASLYRKRNHTNEKSLFCSNYNIWLKAQNQSADFVIIMEDDAILHEKFWPAVTDFVNRCPHFDYVSLDTDTTDAKLSADRHDMCGSSDHSALFRPPLMGFYWGTQVQIVRKEFLSYMVSQAQRHGMGPLDVWWMLRINNGRSFAWQPNIALQAHNLPAGQQLPADCTHSITNSDINPVFLQESSVTTQMLEVRARGSRKHQLQCVF